MLQMTLGIVEVLGFRVQGLGFGIFGVARLGFTVEALLIENAYSLWTGLPRPKP